MALSGWCGQRGKPAHQWCKSLVCSCVCHVPRTARNKANRRGVETLLAVDLWENGATSKSAPADAPTSVAPGLTANKERLI